MLSFCCSVYNRFLASCKKMKNKKLQLWGCGTILARNDHTEPRMFVRVFTAETTFDFGEGLRRQGLFWGNCWCFSSAAPLFHRSGDAGLSLAGGGLRGSATTEMVWWAGSGRAKTKIYLALLLVAVMKCSPRSPGDQKKPLPPPALSLSLSLAREEKEE